MFRIALSSPDGKLGPLLKSALGSEFRLIAERDLERVKELVRAGQVDALLVDLDSEASSEAQLKLIGEIDTARVPTIILSDDISRPIAGRLVESGAYSRCRRPPSLRELKAVLTRACDHALLKHEVESRGGSAINSSYQASLPLQCDGLIGSSPEMQAVYDLIYRVANLNASVLVRGESGTGKELIAHAIHNVGDRAKAPFVPVYCGAIPETLIESELFGHERGAFTGTTGTRIGYFEQASNGTIFLDEIGELSLQTQTKLLRVLQQKEFARLGSNRPIPLKARLIFATHRDLTRMVAEGTFRLDLYHRINVVSIEAPALANRLSDIPVLANHFMKHYAEVYERNMTGIAAKAMALLQGYDWPGNVRELENVIQSVIVCTDSEVVQPSDLPRALQETKVSGDDWEIPQVGTFEKLLREFKFRIATKAIEDCQGNKTLAAQNLNISRSYLHRLIRAPEEPDQADVA